MVQNQCPRVQYLNKILRDFSRKLEVTNRKIQGITFDLWDTVINDDSDEPKRAKLGLRSKRDERHHVVWNALNNHQSISFSEVRQAYEDFNDEFNRVWHHEYVTWTVTERMNRVLEKLGRSLSDQEFTQTVESLEDMELDLPPDPIPGAGEALEIISSQYPLAVVSDTIMSPGRNLRKWLEFHGLLQYFSGFAFSDEVGRSKPAPAMFETAASQIGTEIEAMVHIGDREHNDIKGAHAMGMRAILFTATRDADAAGTTADAVCSSYSDLPDILNSLNAS